MAYGDMATGDMWPRVATCNALVGVYKD